jgi:hypothetical protein
MEIVLDQKVHTTTELRHQNSIAETLLEVV